MKIYSTLVLLSFLCFYSIESSGKKSNKAKESYFSMVTPTGGNPNHRDHAADENQKKRESRKTKAQNEAKKNQHRNLVIITHHGNKKHHKK